MHIILKWVHDGHAVLGEAVLHVLGQKKTASRAGRCTEYGGVPDAEL